VNDIEVIKAFATTGTREAFGPTLHVEGEVLMLDGWWHTALRVSADTFIVRNEDPPSDTTVIADLAEAFSGRGLSMVGEDLPLIQPITYTAISFGANSWRMWATDLDAANAALTERLTRETTFAEAAPGDMGMESSLGFSAELGGARRLGGLPPSVVLTVGLPKDKADDLVALLADCRVESRTIEELPPDACGALIPSIIVVNTTEQAGRDWAMEVRVSACGRFLPVIGLVHDDGVPLGADEALDVDAPAADWVPTLRKLLTE